MRIPIVIVYILTFDVDDDAFADGRRYAVRCYTKISTHFRAADASQIKLLTLVYSHCKIREAVLLNNRPTKCAALRTFKGDERRNSYY